MGFFDGTIIFIMGLYNSGYNTNNSGYITKCINMFMDSTRKITTCPTPSTSIPDISWRNPHAGLKLGYTHICALFNGENDDRSPILLLLLIMEDQG